LVLNRHQKPFVRMDVGIECPWTSSLRVSDTKRGPMTNRLNNYKVIGFYTIIREKSVQESGKEIYAGFFLARG